MARSPRPRPLTSSSTSRWCKTNDRSPPASCRPLRCPFGRCVAPYARRTFVLFSASSLSGPPTSLAQPCRLDRSSPLALPTPGRPALSRRRKYDSTGKGRDHLTSFCTAAEPSSVPHGLLTAATVAGSRPTTPAGSTSYSIIPRASATADNFAYIFKTFPAGFDKPHVYFARQLGSIWRSLGVGRHHWSDALSP